MYGSSTFAQVPFASRPAPSGGVINYNALLNEAGNAVDVEGTNADLPVTLSDALSTADVQSATPSFLVALADTDTITDATGALGNLTALLTESGNALDTATVPLFNVAVSAADTSTISDIAASSAILPAVRAETDALTDTSASSAVSSRSIAESGVALELVLGSVASTAVIAEPGTISDAASLNVVALLRSVAETDALSDARSATAALFADMPETDAAADTSTAVGSALVSQVESDSVYELVSSMAAFSAGVTDAQPMTDTQAAIRSIFVSDPETLAAVDAPSAFMPIPPRSINELAPLTDEAHTPPFIPGVAVQLEYLDGEDMDTVSIMQASQSHDDLAFADDSESAVPSIGYLGVGVDGYSLVDQSDGFVYLFYTASTADTGTIDDPTDALAGYTASITELEDYFVIDMQDALNEPVVSVSDTLALTDVQTKAQNAFVERLEALSAADTVGTGTIQRQVFVVETLALVDHESAAFNAGGKSVHETLAIVDTQRTGKAVAVSTADALSLIDAANRAPGLLRSVHEIDTLADLVGVPSFTLHKAMVEACNAIDQSRTSFLVFRVQAETANAADHPNAGGAGQHYTAAQREQDPLVDMPNAIKPYVVARTEVLRAVDTEHALDVSGFIIGNPERVTIPYRRRVWVISSTRQD